jgi:hypothetical protein
MFMWPCIMINVYNKTNYMHYLLKFIFGMKLHVFDSSSVHRQEFFTVHTAVVYVIQIAVSKPVWHIPLLCVQWKTHDDGQRNCLKHVEFHSKNKFEKLVHLVGFIINRCVIVFKRWHCMCLGIATVSIFIILCSGNDINLALFDLAYLYIVWPLISDSRHRPVPHLCML